MPSLIPKPVVLCILDGWGITKDGPANAISLARCSNFQDLWNSFPRTLLATSGQSVGLPEGTVGNSEVGHLNLGAGYIVPQDILRINTSISDGSFFQNRALLAATNHVKTYNSCIHLAGLIGSGFVHSSIDHLHALLEFIKKQDIPASKVKLHLFTDGRDSPPSSALSQVLAIETRLKEKNLGEIASICGRYYAMDRDNRWDRTQKAYLALLGKSPRKGVDASEIIEESYLSGKTEEFIEPATIIDANGQAKGPVKAQDAIIFFNFRPDRVRQLVSAFILHKFQTTKTSSNETVQTFDRPPKITGLFVVTMTHYAKNLPVSAVAFSPIQVVTPLARVISERNLKQLHIAETEKYAHVTYFFNGGREEPFPGEDRLLIDSKKVAFYNQVPQMSAPEITDRLIVAINIGTYDFIIVNFANADMVAHTGDLGATISAVETLDNQLGRLKEAVLEKNGGLIITADHGNAEAVGDSKTGEIDTQHNSSPAPLILAFDKLRGKKISAESGVLADVAVTALSILGIPKPSAMTGVNFIAELS